MEAAITGGKGGGGGIGIEPSGRPSLLEQLVNQILGGKQGPSKTPSGKQIAIEMGE